MKLLAISCVLVGLSLQDVVSRGYRCKGKTPTIRYFCHSKHKACYPFLYEGCGGDDNNYESSSECWGSCVPADYSDCGYGKESEGICNTYDNDGNMMKCNATQTCTMGAFFGFCCEDEYLDRANKPQTCQNGGTVVKNEGGFYPLVSTSCKNYFCPRNSRCVQGEFVAWCCQYK